MDSEIGKNKKGGEPHHFARLLLALGNAVHSSYNLILSLAGSQDSLEGLAAFSDLANPIHANAGSIPDPVFLSLVERTINSHQDDMQHPLLLSGQDLS